MLQLKKQASTLEIGELSVGDCPACHAFVSHIYFMQDAKSKRASKWYACNCGIVFQNKQPGGIYDAAYRKKYSAFDSKTKSAYEYPVRIYAPIIEELTYSRNALFIGCPTFHQNEAFRARGWVDYTIDKNDSYEPSDRAFVADFESFQFPEGLKFNLIWIYSTLECLIDPIAALSKMKELLTEDGILFIASPDTDFINTRSSSNFIHWKDEYNHIMWNRRSISRHLESLGFVIIMNRQNYGHRFPAQDDFHCLAQRKFF